MRLCVSNRVYTSIVSLSKVWLALAPVRELDVFSVGIDAEKPDLGMCDWEVDIRGVLLVVGLFSAETDVSGSER
jgi:hypothetical protein